MPFMKEHESLYIEGEIAPRFRLKPEEIKEGKKAPYSFKIKGIMLLGNVVASYVKALAINLDTVMLKEEFRKNLIKVLKEFKGDTPLKVFLFDAKSGYRLELFSKKFSVSVCSDFLDALDHLGISYQAQR